MIRVQISVEPNFFLSNLSFAYFTLKNNNLRRVLNLFRYGYLLFIFFCFSSLLIWSMVPRSPPWFQHSVYAWQISRERLLPNTLMKSKARIGFYSVEADIH